MKLFKSIKYVYRLTAPKGMAFIPESPLYGEFLGEDIVYTISNKGRTLKWEDTISYDDVPVDECALFLKPALIAFVE